jgi:hypothetical protein
MNIAQVGNTAAIAAVGSKGLFFYWQEIGGASWQSELVAAPTPPVVEASLAQVDNTAAIAAVRQDGSLWYYWQTIGDTGPWKEEQVDTPNTVSSASLAQVDRTAAIAAFIGSRLNFYWQEIGGGSWSAEPVADLTLPLAGASLAQVDRTAAIAAVRQDGSLSYHWQPIGDSGPWNEEQVAGPPSTASLASLAQVDRTVAIAVVRQNSSLWYYWQNIGGGPWSPEPLTGPIATGTSLAQLGNQGNTFVGIAEVRQDHSLRFISQLVSTVNQPWNFHVAYSPTATSLPITAVSLAQVGETGAIAAVRQDGSLWFYWWRIVVGAVTWKEELVAPAGSVLVPPLRAIPTTLLGPNRLI